jgi:hypothetical protein
MKTNYLLLLLAAFLFTGLVAQADNAPVGATDWGAYTITPESENISVRIKCQGWDNAHNLSHISQINFAS